MMQAQERYRLLAEVQGEFEAELASLPTALRPSVLRSYEAGDSDSPGLLSLVALPYWIGERLGISSLVCRDLAVGNLFLLHLFQSFDFIVDDDRPDIDERNQVVLGNLCYQKVLKRYQPHIQPEALFWERMGVYWQEWAESMLWEVETSGVWRPYTDEFVYQSAHKAAALKICPTALALLAGRPEWIPSLETCVDGMHAVMQLADDLFDWQEDLAHHRYNALLGVMVSRGYLAAKTPIYSEQVSTLLVSSEILQEYLAISKRLARQTTSIIETLEIDPWIRLVNGLVVQIQHMADSYYKVIQSL